MADPFIAEIGSLIVGQGYQVVLSTEPKYRDYDPALPTVFVNPCDSPDIKWMAFGKRNVKQTYDIVYMFNNSLDTTITDNNIWNFKNTVISLFMGLPAGLFALGAWQSRVDSVSDYDKYLLKQGYTYSIMKMKLDYIQNN